MAKGASAGAGGANLPVSGPAPAAAGSPPLRSLPRAPFRFPDFAGAFTLLELMVAIVVIALIVAFAFPNLIRSRMAGNESRVIGLLKSYTAGAEQFRTQNQRSPQRHEAFVTQSVSVVPWVNDPGFDFTYICSCQHPDDPPTMIEWECPQRYSGFRFIFYLKMWKGSNNAKNKFSQDPGYEVFAWPEKVGKTGNRAFYMDETGVIRAGVPNLASLTDCQMVHTGSSSEFKKDEFRRLPPLSP